MVSLLWGLPRPWSSRALSKEVSPHQELPLSHIPSQALYGHLLLGFSTEEGGRVGDGSPEDSWGKASWGAGEMVTEP